MTTTLRTSNARLLRLAGFLRGLPRKRFAYGYWVGLNWQGAADLSCGTSACALGWATTIPSLRRAGLRLRSTSSGTGYVALDSDKTPNNTADVNGCLAAACEVFGLAHDEAHHLFIPGDDEFQATPKMVAKKIERFVRYRQNAQEGGRVGD